MSLPDPADYLLVVTEDGYGKRVAVDEIRRTKRGRQGVSVSKVPIAASLIVDDATAEIILQARAGKTQRIRTTSIPRRRQRHPSRGVRVMRLDKGDRVASVARVSDIAAGAQQTHAPGSEAQDQTDTWVGPRRLRGQRIGHRAAHLRSTRRHGRDHAQR